MKRCAIILGLLGVVGKASADPAVTIERVIAIVEHNPVFASELGRAPLDALIDDALLDFEIGRLGRPDPGRVQHELDRVFADSNLGERELDEQLAQGGLTLSRYRALISRQLGEREMLARRGVVPTMMRLAELRGTADIERCTAPAEDLAQALPLSRSIAERRDAACGAPPAGTIAALPIGARAALGEVARVVVRGHRLWKTDRITAVLQVHSGAPLTLSAVQEDLVRLVQLGAFRALEARLERGPGGTVLTYLVEEHPQTGAIFSTIMPAAGGIDLSAVVKPGVITFHASRLLGERLRADLVRSGYPRPQVTISRRFVERSIADYCLEIVPGPYAPKALPEPNAPSPRAPAIRWDDAPASRP